MDSARTLQAPTFISRDPAPDAARPLFTSVVGTFTLGPAPSDIEQINNLVKKISDDAYERGWVDAMKEIIQRGLGAARAKPPKSK